jgi:CDP-diacylglycerol--serine O-phosphatidyltransferase
MPATPLSPSHADGHVARALQAASAFGAEMDSLCDLVDFGVSPAIVVYLWFVAEQGSCMIWSLAFGFVMREHLRSPQ